MKYMLDTDTCIYIIKKKPPKIYQKFTEIQYDDLCISSITLAELQYGVEKSQAKKRNQTVVDLFTSNLLVVDFDAPAARIYGEIRATVEEKGKTIGGNDYLIAAHALSLHCSIVTNNIKEFKRIPKLKSVNWLT